MRRKILSTTGETVRSKQHISTSETDWLDLETLGSLRTLKVAIDPDRGRNRYPATLAALRLG
jgi:hypothetical protein